MSKDMLVINHGTTTHKWKDRYDCMTCLNAEIDFLQEIRKAGGVTKWAEEIKKLFSGHNRS